MPRVRFTLRSLMIAVAVAAVLLSIGLWTRHLILGRDTFIHDSYFRIR
jgi:hypothetical protein